MKALFIQHDHVSPTGWVGEALKRHGFELTEVLVVPEAQFESPNVKFEFPDFNDFDLLVPLGAPWGAWDDSCIGNWLTPELEWVRNAIPPIWLISNMPNVQEAVRMAGVRPTPRQEKLKLKVNPIRLQKTNRIRACDATPNVAVPARSEICS